VSESKDLSNLTGIYRAKVTDNEDPLRAARVKVWIPDIMPKIDDSQGIWAMPANNAIGGRNLDGGSNASFGGQCLIPPRGTYCFVFFECGNPSRPYYFGALDLSGSQSALPECRVGKSPSDKWVLLKSPDGRCITISDDPSDCRVEITGKKRNINDPPNGDTESVYEIDTNQTTILLDERTGKEKLLIRSYKGDFINFDIETQRLEIRVRNKIDLVCVGEFNLFSSSDMNITSQGVLTLSAVNGIVIQSGLTVNVQAAADVNVQSWGLAKIQGMVSTSIQSAGSVNIDAPILSELNGTSIPPIPPFMPIMPVLPSGKRDPIIGDI